MEITYREILSDQTHLLRQKILRPHQSLEEMVYSGDEQEEGYHVAAFVKEAIVGIASLYPESQNGELNQGSWRIRGMAVESQYRGRGMGRELIRRCILRAQDQGASHVWCNARSKVIGFYKAIGFKVCGKEFEVKGIGPHFVVTLVLS